jgi:hypothetical protein
MTDEYLVWQDLDNLPSNMISNLTWLIPFALNIWRQGNVDNLNFGTFIYTDKND